MRICKKAFHIFSKKKEKTGGQYLIIIFVVYKASLCLVYIMRPNSRGALNSSGGLPPGTGAVRPGSGMRKPPGTSRLRTGT
jgi:hypothetical protein